MPLVRCTKVNFVKRRNAQEVITAKKSQKLEKRFSPLVSDQLKILLPKKTFPIEELSSLLPRLKVIMPKKRGDPLRFILAAKHNRSLVRFFLEMVTQWLLPGRRLDIDTFHTSTLKLGEEKVSLLEAVWVPDTEVHLHTVKTHLPFLTSEIEFGAKSSYQAMQILEIKGMSLGDKIIALQEDLSYLAARFPGQIDSDIYSVMRFVMISCSEHFKRMRQQSYLTKMVQVFYRQFQKVKNSVGNQRVIDVQISQVEVKLPLDVERRWGVFLALSGLGQNEVFDLKLLASLVAKKKFGTYQDDAELQFEMNDVGGHFFYVEIPERDLSELASFKHYLIRAVAQSIQKFVRPIFMPRNDEEVMKNIVVLSDQLRSQNDIPQVMIHFDKHTESLIVFRVLMVRPLKEGAKTIRAVKEELEQWYRVTLERTRTAGMIRKKTPKEASVMTLVMSSNEFVRSDSTIDMYKARYAIYRHMQQVLGEVRDYNGGLLAKQREKLEWLKDEFQMPEQEMLLENFFFALYPVEYRTVWENKAILHFFQNYIHWRRKEKHPNAHFVQVAADADEQSFFKQFPSGMQLKLHHSEIKVLGWSSNL